MSSVDGLSTNGNVIRLMRDEKGSFNMLRKHPITLSLSKGPFAKASFMVMKKPLALRRKYEYKNRHEPLPEKHANGARR